MVDNTNPYSDLSYSASNVVADKPDLSSNPYADLSYKNQSVEKSDNNGLNWLERLPGDIAGGIFNNLNNLTGLPKKIADTLSDPEYNKVTHTRKLNVPSFGYDPTYNAQSQTFGITNPSLLDKIAEGVGEFIPGSAIAAAALPEEALAAGASFTSKIASGLPKSALAGALSNPLNPAIGGLTGAGLHVGLGSVGNIAGSVGSKVLPYLRDVAAKANAGDIMQQASKSLRNISDNIRQTSFFKARENNFKLKADEVSKFNTLNSITKSPVGDIPVDRSGFDDIIQNKLDALKFQSYGRKGTAMINKPAEDMLDGLQSSKLENMNDLVLMRKNINDYFNQSAHPDGFVPLSTVKEIHGDFVKYANNQIYNSGAKDLGDAWRSANEATERRIQNSETLPDGSASSFKTLNSLYTNALNKPDIYHPQDIPVGDFTKDYPILPQDVNKTNANLRSATRLLGGNKVAAKKMMLNDYMEPSYTGNAVNPIASSNLINSMHPDIKDTFLGLGDVKNIDAINALRSKFSQNPLSTDKTINDMMVSKLHKYGRLLTKPISNTNAFKNLITKSIGGLNMSKDDYNNFLINHLAGDVGGNEENISQKNANFKLYPKFKSLVASQLITPSTNKQGNNNGS